MASFPARYDGLCEPCGEDIKRGDYIRNHPQSGYVHEECFENVGKVAESHAEARELVPRGQGPILVMPPGKTAKDRCDRCFIVHTPGQGDEC